MASSTITFFLALLIGLLASSALADDNNILLTGEVLPTDSTLSVPGATLVIQNDCNLVLYNSGNGFQSGTSGSGHGCTLFLNSVGQLVINTKTGFAIWSSPNLAGPSGNYAAVLRPDGQLAIYGPALWSTPALSELATAAAGKIPAVGNVLFSSQVLYHNASLRTRDYTFMMGDDCNLSLTKAGTRVLFESGTQGNGANCFARLDHRGRLSVLTDEYKTVFATAPLGKEGEYVLIMQINGQAVIYGPKVWSTDGGVVGIKAVKNNAGSSFRSSHLIKLIKSAA